MDPIEIETNITLSRTAGGDIPFGVAVQRIAKDVVGVYGAGTNPLVTGTEVWTPVSIVVATNPMEGLDGAKCVKLVTGTVIGSLAYWSLPALKNLASNTHISALVKSSIAQALQLGVSELNNFGSPLLATGPTLVANEWTYIQLPYTAGSELLRDAVLTAGIARTVNTPSDVYIQLLTSNAGIAYDIAGIAKNDEARDENIAKQFDTLTVLATGHINPVVVDNFVCIAEQPVYFVPGTGKVTTTKIATNTNVRTGYATEDQATAGKQTGVRF